MNDYLERQEGPDGQFCDLYSRVSYDQQRMIESGLSVARNVRDQQHACLLGLMSECSVKDTFTGETTTDVGRAAANVIQPWRERAVELYNAWFKEAFPGPKGFSRTASRTPRSGKTPRPSETSEPR